MPNLFEQLDAGRSSPATEETVKHDNLHERLLNWLVHNWPHDRITARQLRVYGPYPIRSETKAILDLAQGLVERGWLFPVVKTRQHNMRQWKIGRGSQRP
jgi:hypothetical protein